MIANLSLYYFTFATFIFGACLGSFFKLIIDRYKNNESIIFKPSYCFNCKHRLSWWQNIPILSYLILCNKCFFCKAKIDINCFYSELATALLLSTIFFFALTRNINHLHILLLLIFSLVLILVSMFDLKHRIIPHSITYPSILILIIFHNILKTDGLTNSLLNLGIAFLFMDLLYISSSLFKKFDLEPNFITVPLILWTIYYYFAQNLNFIFLIIALCLLTSRLKTPENISRILWIAFLPLLCIQIYKIVLIEHHYINLTNYFVGIGIIYLTYEILFYFLNLLLLPTQQTLETQPDPLKITLGGGDITVFVLISVFLGYKLAFLTLFFASLLAVISHLITRTICIFTKSSKEKISQHIPFVPYLSIVCFIIILKFNGS